MTHKKHNEGGGGGTNWITTWRQNTKRRWKVPARVPTRFCEILNYVQAGVARVSRTRGSWIMVGSCFIRTQKDGISFSSPFFARNEKNRGAIGGVLWHLYPLLYQRPLQSRHCLLLNDVTQADRNWWNDLTARPPVENCSMVSHWDMFLKCVFITHCASGDQQWAVAREIRLTPPQ